MRIYLLLLLSLIAISIFAQDITQFQTFIGYKYFIDAQPLTKLEVEELLTAYPEAHSDWERAKRAEVVTWVLAGAELGFAYLTISRTVQSKTTALPLYGVLATGVGAIIFSFQRRKLLRTALLSYNQLNNQPRLSLNANGLGLTFKF